MSPALNVVVAPDSFKGSATAAEVAAAIGAGWSEARPDDAVTLAPMADGGEGTIDAFAVAVPGALRIPVTVTGPDDRPVETHWLWLPPAAGDTGTGGTGVVELASTSGITLLDTLRPMDAHTFGLGQAIAAALDHGVDKLVLAIGGSSSTDGGAGALTALGARISDAAGNPVAPGGRGLAAAASVDLSGLRALPLDGATVISDVTNPLLGENGAAAVFAPQKGADPAEVAELDAALAAFARAHGADAAGVAAAEAPADLSEWPSDDASVIADHTRAGAGAAGGTGFGLMMWGASIQPGAAAVGDVIGLPARVEAADVVITGEGRFDNQSAAGKVPSYVLELARRFDTFALLVAGSIETDPDDFAAYVSLTELAGGSAEAIANPAVFLHAAGRSLARGDAKTPEGSAV